METSADGRWPENESDISPRRPAKIVPQDDRPIPQTERPAGLLARTIGEHFSSHPPTEKLV